MRQQGGERRADQDEPFTPLEGELLVAAFGGEQAAPCRASPLCSQTALSGLADCWLAVAGRRVGASVRVTYTWRATRWPMVRVCPSISTTSGPSNGCFSTTATSTPGDDAERAEEREDLGVGRARHRHLGHVARLEVVELGRVRQVGGLGLGDGEAVRAGVRPVQRHEQALGHLVGQLVLERHGQLVGLVPGVAEHVGEEALDDAVAADGGDRRPAGPRR